MTPNPIRKTLALAALVAVAAFLAPAPASAFDSEVAACVTACATDARACVDEIRASTLACLEEAGCQPLVDAAKAACEADRESEECAAAREAATACVAPCRDDDRDAREGCRAARITCLKDECGLDDATVQCGHFRPGRDGSSR